LHKALLARGYDVTRTPVDWMPLDAGDKEQLLGASERGRIIFRFNVANFMHLAKRHPEHAGIILAEQRSWPLSRQIGALDRLLREAKADEFLGQIRWLNEWHTPK
jgi:hypothetical protein